MDKTTIIDMLDKFIRQRPGLEFGNYGDVKAYRSELRQITKDRQQALELLQAVKWRDSITAEHIIEASKHAYSGRLSFRQRDDGSMVLDYCTGQYFPTEYRRAVCAVLSSVLWDYWRDNTLAPGTPDGDRLRIKARQEFGRGIASRWFN